MRTFLRKYIMFHGNREKSDFWIGQNFPEWFICSQQLSQQDSFRDSKLSGKWNISWELMIHMIEQFYHDNEACTSKQSSD